MGKVYDALQRAEGQRTRRLGEASIAPRALDATPASRPRRRFWRRLFLRRRAPRAEDPGSLNKRRIALLQPQSHVAEQFRTLRATLDSLAAERPLRTIVVTSALAGDGKTTSAVNLALVTSMGVGRRVLLVDCDLREPEVHESLGLRVDAGLAEILRGEASLEEALLAVEGTALHVLPVRDVPQNPAELLASAAMRDLIAKLGERFDTVVFDAPPTLGLPDAKSLVGLCDGALMVVRAGSTSREDVEAAIELLGRERVVGLVLNSTEASPKRYGYA